MLKFTARCLRAVCYYRPSTWIAPACHPNSLLILLAPQSLAAAMSGAKFACDYAKRGQAGCKKCKQKLEKGSLRLAKVVPNPFSDNGGDMKQWYHMNCLFETFERARATTKVIEALDDVEGFTDLTPQDKEELNKHIDAIAAKRGAVAAKTPSKKGSTKAAAATSAVGGSPDPASALAVAKGKHATLTNVDDEDTCDEPEKDDMGTTSSSGKVGPSTAAGSTSSSGKDDSFREFRKLCGTIAEHPSYNDKTAVVAKFLRDGDDGSGYTGDTYLLVKLLLPGVVKRVYNVNSKQLFKFFGQLFGVEQSDMLADFDSKGDAAETVKTFFDSSNGLKPQTKCTLTLQEVDAYLEDLSKLTKEEDQMRLLKKIASRCTSNDLKMIVRLIMKDLRINAGAKHILDALDPNAYEAFQASRDLQDVVTRILENRKDAAENGKGLQKKLSVRAVLMTPVLPMLAEACRSLDTAFKKCASGMYAEIKYDGERVQLHMQGDSFQFYSRSLKPVLPHKVEQLKEFIPKAFVHGQSFILDSEVLMVDTKTGKPLPFGTLGIHKKAEFKDAQVCLFVFDCLHYNGENLMDKPLKDRREFLHKTMKEIPNRVTFSEQHVITKRSQLDTLLSKVFKEGLEGLVLKDTQGVYEPGKRHWLKVKKDYLNEGAMADTADLVVLGAYYGTGKKGGIMSVFLMGCLDPESQKWCTVTKVSGGHDDKTLERLQSELGMIKISKDPSKVPSWLKVNKGLVPDFISSDPKTSQVWEITGAEFSKAEIHTAAGISIRFPRVTKIRDDKDWKTATDLPRLKQLFEISKQASDVDAKAIEAEASPSKGTLKVTTASTIRAGMPSSSRDNKVGASVEVDESSPRKAGAKHKLATEDGPLTKTQVLMDIFMDKTFFITGDVKDAKKLRRYVIAHGGKVVEEYDKSDASFVVTNDPEQSNGVPESWVWDCVARRKLLPT